jgi:hypothetical protein
LIAILDDSAQKAGHDPTRVRPGAWGHVQADLGALIRFGTLISLFDIVLAQPTTHGGLDIVRGAFEADGGTTIDEVLFIKDTAALMLSALVRQSRDFV